MSKEFVKIRKVAEPFGALGNMSPHKVDTTAHHWMPDILRREWRTSEALFQAMRFCGSSNETVDEVITDIWRHKSPMGAKLVAKKNQDSMLVDPCSFDDTENMRTVLWLKLGQNAEVAEVLTSTIGMTIVEDCSNRMSGSGLFWGAALMHWGRWVGENHLGKILMDIRKAKAAEAA